jgi:site-specific recombinase XerD
MSKIQKNTPSSFIYKSHLAPWFNQFIQEKRALGFRYNSGAFLLSQLDRLLQEENIKTEELPRTIIEQWLKPKPYNKPVTLNRKRILVRQVATFLIRNDIPTYIPPNKGEQIKHDDYIPRIFSKKEIQKLLAAADSLSFYPRFPLRHLIVPEVLRLLYGCGLRVSEVMQLQVKDVNLTEGVLTIMGAKGNNNRLVPIASSLRERLRNYNEKLGNRSLEAPFFPAPDGRFCGRNWMYINFRKLLEQIGISHGGRGKGPRLHDLRHTFAVHSLIRWYHEGADINAKLPVLAAYLGHQHLTGTQRYLHLTAELFPDITSNLESVLGHVIPRREVP